MMACANALRSVPQRNVATAIRHWPCLPPGPETRYQTTILAKQLTVMESVGVVVPEGTVRGKFAKAPVPTLAVAAPPHSSCLALTHVICSIRTAAVFVCGIAADARESA